VTFFHRLVRSAKAFSRHFSQADLRQSSPGKIKLGVALGGGFARGLAHIGVLKVLEEEGIAIDCLAGTSVGSVIAAAYCSGASARELEEIARLVRFRDFARWSFSRYGICNSDRMAAFLSRILKAATFEELKIPLAVAATDFLTGEPVVFRGGPICDPVRASCAYPGMFAPVEIAGRLLVDGMLGHAVPTTPLRQMGAGYVLGISLSAHWLRMNGPRHLFDVIGQCFSIAQARMSVHWKKDADLVLEPEVDGFAYDAFDRSAELIANGERAMRAALPTLKQALAGHPAPAAFTPGGAAAPHAVELAGQATSHLL
jgi:NTE family protein